MKSNHKHNYQDCLLECSEYSTFYEKQIDKCYKAKYCTICGKIKDINFMETERIGKCARIMILQDLQTMQQKYPNIPIFQIKDIWKNKFVTLN